MWARANRGAGPDSAADDDPSLRAHRRAPRAPRLAARPRHRYAARLGPGDVREGRVDDSTQRAQGVLIYESRRPPKNYPQLGALTAADRAVPLYGVRVDWPSVSNPRCPLLGAAARP